MKLCRQQRVSPVPLLLFALILGAISTCSAIDSRYWVWQRDDPLNEQELAELAAQKVQTIYWQVGELENNGEGWRWKARFDVPTSAATGIRLLPAVRLVSHERRPFTDTSIANLMAQLAPVARDAEELQLDYDAPDRLLADYSGALKRIHQIAAKVSITALPHWSRSECLAILEPSVDELLPMLYDFEAEPVLNDDAPLPLMTPKKIAKLINDWHACGKPWRAGLPIFARLSLYDSNRRLRGQIRNWNWDEVCFNRGLEVVRPDELGTSVLRATKPSTIANTTVKTGEELVVHNVAKLALASAVSAATAAGAQGIVFFRLPDSSASSGWSLHQLGHLSAQPRLIAQYSSDGNALELYNVGDGDLEPRFAAEQNNIVGGYALEIESDAAIFREAEPGDFASSTSFAAEKPVAIPFATKLRFGFSQIRAKQKFKTGLIQLAPGRDFRHARYRILKPEGACPWQSLQLKPE